MKTGKTPRGFPLIEFKDFYLQECSLQESSLACYNAIWLGVDNTGPQLEDDNGKKNANVPDRMHLERKQVKALIPILQYFVKHGALPSHYNKNLSKLL